MKTNSKVLFVAIATIFISCGSEEVETAKNAVTDSVYTIEPKPLAVKTPDQLTDAKGIIGIFDVPEMLTVLKMDSAALSKVSAKLAKTYVVIQEDIKSIKAEVNGAAGALYYNNDTSNFVFECVIPISKMPKKQPKNSQIVALEASKMIIYNYYGAYSNLSEAYAELGAFCKKHQLKQIGPMREFYITDPSANKDTAQWLTRVMLPVN